MAEQGGEFQDRDTPWREIIGNVEADVLTGLQLTVDHPDDPEKTIPRRPQQG